MNTETSTHSLPTDYVPSRKGTKFVAFYSTSEAPTEYFRTEHKTEAAARKNNLPSPAMKKIFFHRGYIAV